jgi:hypothetical protein
MLVPGDWGMHAEGLAFLRRDLIVKNYQQWEISMSYNHR